MPFVFGVWRTEYPYPHHLHRPVGSVVEEDTDAKLNRQQYLDWLVRK